MKNNNDDYRFEEKDDPRTYNDELVSDLDRIEKEELDKAESYIKCLEYVEEFLKLIDGCGKTEYYRCMYHNVSEKVKNATNVAEKYQHNVQYYAEKRISWTAKTRRSFKTLKWRAEQIGYSIEDEEKVFLNDLALSPERRKCYRYYLRQFKKNGKMFSPDELEIKYVQRKMKNP